MRGTVHSITQDQQAGGKYGLAEKIHLQASYSKFKVSVLHKHCPRGDMLIYAAQGEALRLHLSAIFYTVQSVYGINLNFEFVQVVKISCSGKRLVEKFLAGKSLED